MKIANKNEWTACAQTNAAPKIMLTEKQVSHGTAMEEDADKIMDSMRQWLQLDAVGSFNGMN